ncbi:MAG: hypothetical protein IJK18_01525 [Clostridia bacterium]|nr:hypothetical protein [Clostridia bacterium]
MENEIKVNEFVRTKNGQIYKIEDGTEFYEDSVNVGIGIIPDVDGIWVDKEHFTYVDKREIVKHSPNLIDLIECGDYVNGEQITDIWNGNRISSVKSNFNEEDIKNIVTKEMMESISYKVTKM